MSEKKTVLSLSNEEFGTEYVGKDSWDCNIHKMADLCYGVLRAAGYAHNTIALVLDCEETYETREEMELRGEL